MKSVAAVYDRRIFSRAERFATGLVRRSETAATKK